jgi:hypothetical protein
MLSRHPLSTIDLILPIGFVTAATGYFYPSLALLVVWGWLNKRRALRFQDQLVASSSGSERGESLRKRLGIHGDAKDVEHPYIPERLDGPCLLCNLPRSFSRHYRVSADRPPGAPGNV